MKKEFISLLICASILYLTGCEDNPVNDSDVNNQFGYFKLGAYWSYQQDSGLQRYYSEKVILEEANDFYKIQVTFFMIDSTIGGNNISIDTTLIAKDTIYKRITSQGLMIYDKRKEENFYVLKKPYINGNTWIDSVDENVHMSFTIINQDTLYAIPGKTFTNCIKVQRWSAEIFPSYFQYIFSPDVGMVQYGNYRLYNYSIP